MKLLLSPHHDDAELFACYTILLHQPFVAVCFSGSPRHGDAITRRQETAAAMKVLGTGWRKLSEPDDLEEQLRFFDPEWVWAPYPEPDGHSQHNLVGELAIKLWPDRVSLYTTYTLTGGRTTFGEPVEPEPGWAEQKLEALACYESQFARPGTRVWFEGPQDEYIVEYSRDRERVAVA